MLYNSFPFLLFFPITSLLYFAVPQRLRWIYLLFVSYFFYMNWNPAYALLMISLTIITFVGALAIEKQKNAKAILTTVLLGAFTPLIVFKYLNFINASIFEVLSFCGLRMEVPRLDLLLPVGISFYTFQTVGYVIDVYRKKISAERNIGLFALFVAFFPQIAAGPIGRAASLLPQFRQEHKFNPDNISKGLKWMLWGYFMKVAIADRLALYTDAVMSNIEYHSGLSILVAAVFFSFQIYCDFGGYSLIALGCAKVLGFDLIINFQRPYMAKSVAEFWHRWHISLSTWFKDYLYIPLGGSRCGKWRTRTNLIITFLVSGLWHGANWTFIIWGGLNGIFQVIGNIIKPFKEVCKKKFNFQDNSRTLEVFNICSTFTLMTVAWVFFKANSLQDALVAVQKMVVPIGKLYVPQLSTLLYCIMGLIILIPSDISQERKGYHPLLENKNCIIRFTTYILLAVYILIFGVFDGGQFIYFQF